MKTYFFKSRERGFTLAELLVIMAIIALMAIMVYPGGQRDKRKAKQVACMSDLKQVGLGFRIWAGDQTATFPMHRSVTNGGTMEFAVGRDAFRHFQVMSNELQTPQLLICPVDTARVQASTFNLAPQPSKIPFSNNSNLSYFVSIDATDNEPNEILCGDRNITNGTRLKNGVLELTTNFPAAWTGEMHRMVGNILLADGSVQGSTVALHAALTNTPAFTNRLLMPVLGP
jgi:prepilin-type N-terminal cleavage/methylation domain-containing protein